MPKMSFLKYSAGCPKILDYTLKPSLVVSYFLFTKYFVAFLANIGAFCFAASTSAQSAAFPKAEPKLENSAKNPFDNFILADELFAKALWSLETCPPVTNNLCGQYQSHR